MVKLKDIARETGLTISTVSKALNNSREISEATTERVLAAANAMGYRMKHAEVRRETNIIGAILPEVRSYAYAELVHVLSAEVERCGYHLIVAITNNFLDDVAPHIERMLALNVSGLFINSVAGLSKNGQRLLQEHNMPAIILKSIDTDEPFGIDSIYIKDSVGIRLIVSHLLELGHRKIGYLGEYLSFQRHDALCETLKQCGLEVNPAFIKTGEERFEEGGYLRAQELLQEPELPTAVLTSYDQMAYGATRAFMEHGLRVPEDISVVGFDNVAQGAYYPVPLTSTSNPVEQMGITAVKLLMDAIRSPMTHAVQNIAIQGKLVVRESTCPPRSSKGKDDTL